MFCFHLLSEPWLFFSSTVGRDAAEIQHFSIPLKFLLNFLLIHSVTYREKAHETKCDLVIFRTFSTFSVWFLILLTYWLCAGFFFFSVIIEIEKTVMRQTHQPKKILMSIYAITSCSQMLNSLVIAKYNIHKNEK